MSDFVKGIFTQTEICFSFNRYRNDKKGKRIGIIIRIITGDELRKNKLKRMLRF